MSIQQAFEQAQKDVKTLTRRPSNDDMLALYSLYKQGVMNGRNKLSTQTLIGSELVQCIQRDTVTSGEIISVLKLVMYMYVCKPREMFPVLVLNPRLPGPPDPDHVRHTSAAG